MPVASMQNFAGTCVELGDSNHTDVCKPTNKQHEAYTELVKFASDILENSKVLIFDHGSDCLFYLVKLWTGLYVLYLICYIFDMLEYVFCFLVCNIIVGICIFL